MVHRFIYTTLSVKKSLLALMGLKRAQPMAVKGYLLTWQYRATLRKYQMTI